LDEAIARHIIAFDHGKLEHSASDGQLSRYARTDHCSWNADLLEQQLFA
jgi:hypothetical protein